MICPNCQSNVSTSDIKCRTCSSAVRNVSTPVPAFTVGQTIPLNSAVTVERAFTCPTCQSAIDSTLSGGYCPVCNSSVTLPTSDVRLQRIHESTSSPVPYSGGQSTGTAPHVGTGRVAPVSSSGNYGAGTIVGDPTQLQDETRDADPLQVLVSLLLLIELAIILAAVSVSVLIVGIIIIAIALSFRLMGGFLAMGCLSNLIRAPMAMAAATVRTLFSGISPRLNPANLRHVREYRLDLIEGSQGTFVVKGNTSPRTLRSGDRVRVWTVQRNGRPYLRRGLLDENGALVPIRVSERSTGVQWLVGFIALNLVLAFIYFTYLSG